MECVLPDLLVNSVLLCASFSKNQAISKAGLSSSLSFPHPKHVDINNKVVIVNLTCFCLHIPFPIFLTVSCIFNMEPSQMKFFFSLLVYGCFMSDPILHILSISHTPLCILCLKSLTFIPKGLFLCSVGGNVFNRFLIA